MTNTLSDPGPYDPLATAPPDAPIFPLVATDRHAPATVEFWVDLTRKEVTSQMVDLAVHEPMPEALKRKLRKCAEAEEIAMEMRHYQKGYPERDTATPTRATYSGAKLDAAGMDEAARREALAIGIQNLREAAFYTCEAGDRLGALGVLEPDEIAALQDALATINRIADAHAPKRPGVQQVLPMGEGVS